MVRLTQALLHLKDAELTRRERAHRDPLRLREEECAYRCVLRIHEEEQKLPRRQVRGEGLRFPHDVLLALFLDEDLSRRHQRSIREE